jgi:hypothetical protein
MPLHVCPRCGKFIRWSLLMCFECNAAIPAASLPTVNGQDQYPPYTNESATTLERQTHKTLH